MFNFKFEAQVNGLELNIQLNGVSYQEDGLFWESDLVEVFNEDGEWLADLNSDELYKQYGICIASDLEQQMSNAGIWEELESAEAKYKAEWEESLAC